MAAGDMVRPLLNVLQRLWKRVLETRMSKSVGHNHCLGSVCQDLHFFVYVANSCHYSICRHEEIHAIKLREESYVAATFFTDGHQQEYETVYLDIGKCR